MFIKVNVRQDASGKIQERRLNVRYITDYWQGTEIGIVILNHDGHTLRIMIDIETLDALLVG
jgi:hypothetical protein